MLSNTSSFVFRRFFGGCSRRRRHHSAPHAGHGKTALSPCPPETFSTTTRIMSVRSLSNSEELNLNLPNFQTLAVNINQEMKSIVLHAFSPARQKLPRPLRKPPLLK